MFAAFIAVTLVACTGGKEGGKDSADSTANEASGVQKVALKVLKSSSGNWYKVFKSSADTIQVEGTLNSDKMNVSVIVPITCEEVKPEQASVKTVKKNPTLSISSEKDDKILDRIELPEDQKAAVLEFLKTAKAGDTKEFTWKTEIPAADFEKFKQEGIHYYMNVLSPQTE